MLTTFPCLTRYLPQRGQFARRGLTASGVIYITLTLRHTADRNAFYRMINVMLVVERESIVAPGSLRFHFLNTIGDLYELDKWCSRINN